MLLKANETVITQYFLYFFFFFLKIDVTLAICQSKDIHYPLPLLMLKALTESCLFSCYQR